MKSEDRAARAARAIERGAAARRRVEGMAEARPLLSLNSPSNLAPRPLAAPPTKAAAAAPPPPSSQGVLLQVTVVGARLPDDESKKKSVWITLEYQVERDIGLLSSPHLRRPSLHPSTAQPPAGARRRKQQRWQTKRKSYPEKGDEDEIEWNQRFYFDVSSAFDASGYLARGAVGGFDEDEDDDDDTRSVASIDGVGSGAPATLSSAKGGKPAGGKPSASPAAASPARASTATGRIVVTAERARAVQRRAPARRGRVSYDSSPSEGGAFFTRDRPSRSSLGTVVGRQRAPAGGVPDRARRVVRAQRRRGRGRRRRRAVGGRHDRGE